ncbi:MAG TPA: hypothetical protein VGO00_03680 [Kofleriaceae bacterium]|nr:hypothetical protein [Kofleriaceae bacterium]
MKIAVVEIDPKPEWRVGLDRLAAELTEAGHEVVRAGPADAWLVCAGTTEALTHAIASADPAQLRRTIVVGCDLGWSMGTMQHAPGTLGHLLETYELAGAVSQAGLIAWKSKPSPFSGLKRLMQRFATNCIKAMQSGRYCSWGDAPGGSLGKFLAAYLSELSAFSDVVAAYLRARDRTGFEQSIHDGLRAASGELEATAWAAWCRGETTAEIKSGPWFGRTLWFGSQLPKADEGDVWFDVCELATMIRLERAWVATRPVSRWRVRAFLAAASIEPREVQVEPPYVALDPSRLAAGPEREPCTDITAGEATLYAWWFGKSLPHTLDWESAVDALPNAIGLWGDVRKEWCSNRISDDESARVFMTPETIGWDANDVADEPKRRDRMIRGEYVHDNAIGFRTIVTGQIGLLRSVSSWHMLVEPVRLASILDRAAFR